MHFLKSRFPKRHLDLHRRAFQPPHQNMPRALESCAHSGRRHGKTRVDRRRRRSSTRHVGSGCLRATSLCSGDGAAPAGAERSGLSVACLKMTTSAHQFHQFHQAGLSGQFCSRGRAKHQFHQFHQFSSLERVFQFHKSWSCGLVSSLGQNSALRRPVDSNVRPELKQSAKSLQSLEAPSQQLRRPVTRKPALLATRSLPIPN